LLPELKEDQFYYHELPGYIVINPGIVVGMKLIKVLEYPAQDLFEIQVDGREQSVLIPVVDAFIERLDKPNTTLYLCAPEELYSL
jgi:16S rRNA processing protein RimM